MNRTKTNFFKGLGAIVLVLVMLITMIPVTEAWADSTMDYTAPVIESASIQEAGETIYMGDSLTLDLVAYDQDSELSMVTISAHCGNHYTQGSIYEVGSPVEGNSYSVNVPITFWIEGEWIIDSVQVTDMTGLSTVFTINQTVTVKRNVIAGSVATVTYDQSTYERTEENLYPTVKFTIKVEGIDESISTINPAFYGGGSTYYGSYAQKTDNGVFEGSQQWGIIGEDTYFIKELYVEIDGQNYYIETINDKGFKYVNSVTDKNSPTLTSVSIDKQGEFVDSGEVTITITAKDEHKINTSGTVDLRSPIENISSRSYPLEQIDSNEDGTEVTFKATVDVSNLPACEWYIGGILISDVVGNGGSAWASNINLSDHYFFVGGEGFIEKTYNNVTVRLSDNNYNTLAEVNATMPRRVKLADVFGDKWIETLPADEELGEFVGWTYNNQLVTKDSTILVEYDNMLIRLSPKYEKQKIQVSYSYLSGNEKDWGNEYIITDKELTYGDIMDMVECPANDDYKFTGWKSYANKDAYVTGNYVSLDATYDKYPMYVELAYLDENGNIKVIEERKDFVAGTTYQQILDSYNTNIEWAYTGYMASYISEEIAISGLDCSAIAQYDDKQIVNYDYSRIGDSEESTEYGEYIEVDGYILVNKETALSEDELAEKVKEIIVPDHFDKLTSAYELVYLSDYNNDNYAETVSLYTEYDDIIINLCAYGFDDASFDRYYIVEPGGAINLPSEINGEKVYWWSENDDEYYTGSFTVSADISSEEGYRYWLYAETELPEGAILNENATITPSTPTTPSTPEVEEPVVELEEEKIEETINKIEEAIKEAEKNDSATEEAKTVQVVVDMKKEDGTVATEVPKEILEAIKGQNVEVVLDMGDYSWTINGNDIKATDLKDINLEVKLNTNNIPSATVEKLANGQETHQLSLTHNGDFGFKAELTINVGKDNAGQYGNLYYYDSDGKLVFMNAGKIDENGNVSLSFSHASEYVVVISDKPVVADTSDNSNITLYVCMLLVGTGLMVVLLKKKNAF